MFVKLPKLSVLAEIADSKTHMYIDPSGHTLFVSIPPDDDILMFVFEEDLQTLTEHEVNVLLQRDLRAGIDKLKNRRPD